MATRANVESLEALVRLRGGIARFVELVGSAVADASSDVNRTLQWLELDRARHWEVERRKRHDQHQQALEALRMKQLYRGVTGERQSTVDEEKRVKQCRAALEEAEWKIRAVAEHRTRLAREAVLFQGVLSRLGQIATQTGPAALAELANLMVSLEQYGSVATEVGSGAGEGGGGGVVEGCGAMVRAVGPSEESSEGGQGAVEVDWKVVERRAWKAWGATGGRVVVELAAMETGAVALVWRDFLRGKVFVTRAGLEGEVGACAGWTVEELLAWSPELEGRLSAPGDLRLVVREGGRVVSDGKAVK